MTTTAETRNWIPITAELPPEGIEVETKIDDWGGVRKVQTLKRQGRIWLLPHGEMYVYYTPTHWREKS